MGDKGKKSAQKARYNTEKQHIGHFESFTRCQGKELKSSDFGSFSLFFGTF